ncbi:MAG: outer membrane protein assembly factor BamD [Mucinivorans sp.]
MRKIILAVLLSVSLSSCGKFTKLLKSSDVEAKYRAAMEFYDAKKYNKTFALFDNVLPSLMGTPREDSIVFLMGKAAYNMEDYISSGQMMDQYRNQFTRSPFTIEAEYLYGMSFYHLSLPPEKDQTDTRRALSAFMEFVSRHPTSPYVKDLQEAIEELNRKLYYKTYLNAAVYYKLGHYQSAVTSLRAALKEYPEIPYKEDMMFLVCKSWYAYARNSVYAKQLDRYLKMIDAYYNFKSAYPESKQFNRELERMLAEAQKFNAENGVMSQAIETTIEKLDKTRQRVEENKNKIFLTKTKEERVTLREENKKLIKSIPQIKKQLKSEKKTAKNNETKSK